MRIVLEVFRRIFYLIFGTLAVVFGFVTCLWVAYNLIPGNMHPAFKRQIGDNIVMMIISLAGGVMLILGMISVGRLWLMKSGILNNKMLAWLKPRNTDRMT